MYTCTLTLIAININTSHHGKEPNTSNEALTSSVRDLWMKAIKEEMKSIKVNKVSDLVNLPPNNRTIGNKWVI